MSVQNNEMVKSFLTYGMSAISGLLCLLYMDLKSQVTELRTQQIQMISERVSPADMTAMENRLSKMVEASINENRNSNATLRGEMNNFRAETNDTLKTILSIIRTGKG